jgi:hypothetical protein
MQPQRGKVGATFDSTRMSIELSHQDIGSPLNPIPTIVNDTPSTLATTMVLVSKEPIIIASHPIVNTQPIAMNPFVSLGHSPGYNVHSILMASSPFFLWYSKFYFAFFKLHPSCWS